jgi:hypothetical protein
MTERKSAPRKRSSPEPATGSASDAAPRSYYASPPMAPPNQPPIYHPMYVPSHYPYYQAPAGSPQHLGPPMGYQYPHQHQGTAPMAPLDGPHHPPMDHSGPASSRQQVTPDSNTFFAGYVSPPSTVKRRTFTSTGTLSPPKRPRRSGELLCYDPGCLSRKRV